MMTLLKYITIMVHLNADLMRIQTQDIFKLPALFSILSFPLLNLQTNEQMDILILLAVLKLILIFLATLFVKYVIQEVQF